MFPDSASTMSAGEKPVRTPVNPLPKSTSGICDQVLEKYAHAPTTPGVYLMKNHAGKIIYVGKAKNLKKRLSSYFVRQNNHDPKTLALIDMIKDFDLVITKSDHEAFILESNLIKQYRPKYNIILKDGKNYPLLRIDMAKEYPAIEQVRRIKKNDTALYFGPYSSSRSMRRTLGQIQKIFRLRKCRDSQFSNRSRPCLNFQIKTCSGPCCQIIGMEAYRESVKDAILFLRGRSGQVIKKLKTQMTERAKAQEFEQAAQIRDTIFAIERALEKQVAVSPDMEDRDVIGMAQKNGSAVITVMKVRSGMLIDSAHFPVDMGFREVSEILSAFLRQYYEPLRFFPSSILLDRHLEDMESLEQSLKQRKKGRVHIHVPMRGEKKHLVDMALRNATEELEKILTREKQDQVVLKMLQKLLGMDHLPLRMECFDNSNMAGQDPVSSMAVFTNGRPDKGAYRKYIVRDIPFQDDYAYMFQTLERRFSKDETQMPWPDLLVVDGGKGQLNMALSVLRELGMEDRFAVAGLAKKDAEKGETADKIYLPGRSNPLNTSQAPKALFLLEQIRDEAHRFAITFQRKRREKRGITSGLDDIPGIGPQRKKMLLKTFQGIKNLRSASVEELCALPGINRTIAENILTALE